MHFLVALSANARILVIGALGDYDDGEKKDSSKFVIPTMTARTGCSWARPCMAIQQETCLGGL